MTPPALLVLVAGVLVVLAIAAVALVFDARRRATPTRRPLRLARSRRSRPAAPRSPSTADAPQTEPIVTAAAREDPPTVAAPRPAEHPPRATEDVARPSPRWRDR